MHKVDPQPVESGEHCLVVCLPPLWPRHKFSLASQASSAEATWASWDKSMVKSERMVKNHHRACGNKQEDYRPCRSVCLPKGKLDDFFEEKNVDVNNILIALVHTHKQKESQ